MTGMNINVLHFILCHSMSGINIVYYPVMKGINFPLIVLFVLLGDGYKLLHKPYHDGHELKSS